MRENVEPTLSYWRITGTEGFGGTHHDASREDLERIDRSTPQECGPEPAICGPGQPREWAHGQGRFPFAWKRTKTSLRTLKTVVKGESLRLKAMMLQPLHPGVPDWIKRPQPGTLLNWLLPLIVDASLVYCPPTICYTDSSSIMRILKLVIPLALVALCGCGTPGAPQPPSLTLPKPITDLKAVRKGNTISLTWTQPTKTTDGMLIKVSGMNKICRGQSGKGIEPKCVEVPANGPAGTYSESTDDSTKGFSTDLWSYTVAAENRKGKSMGTSNSASVPIAHIEFAVSKFESTLAADGVHIHFQTSQLPRTTNSHNTYTIELKTMRAEKGKEVFTRMNKDLAVAAERTSDNGSAWEMVDDTIEWEKTYQYKIVAFITIYGPNTEPLGSYESDDSDLIEVFAHDTFPPEAPTSPQAVANSLGIERSVDLSWTPNTDRDLAGYNVYRRESEFSTKLEKVNKELLQGASYKDSSVKAGHRYEYVVTAVDLRNNESKPSAPTEEKVPE